MRRQRHAYAAPGREKAGFSKNSLVTRAPGMRSAHSSPLHALAAARDKQLRAPGVHALQPRLVVAHRLDTWSVANSMFKDHLGAEIVVRHGLGVAGGAAVLPQRDGLG